MRKGDVAKQDELCATADTSSVFPILMVLWQRGQLSTRVCRALWHAAHQEEVFVPGTLDTMRAALREPGTPLLHVIPGIGPKSIVQLQRVLLTMDIEMTEEERQGDGSTPLLS